MDLAQNQLINRVRELSREQLLRLDVEELADIDHVLSEAKNDQFDKRCAEPIASFDAGPLFWLTTFTATENPHHEHQGLPYRAPFPMKKHFVPLFEAFLEYEGDHLFIPKSREMMTSWSVVGYATWRRSGLSGIAFFKSPRRRRSRNWWSTRRNSGAIKRPGSNCVTRLRRTNQQCRS